MFFTRGFAVVYDYIAAQLATLTTYIDTQDAAQTTYTDTEIATLKTYVDEQVAGAGGMTYIDRGDIGAYDNSIGSMTVDNNWHDWDISGIIDAGTKLVLLQVIGLAASATGKWFRFRRKGGEDTYNIARIIHHATTVGGDYVCFVVPDVDGVIQYNIRTNITSFTICIRGWFV